MSYPPVRFDGATGAVNAAFRPRATPPDLATARGSVEYLATGRTTAGEFGMYRWNMDHGVSGPDARGRVITTCGPLTSCSNTGHQR